MQVPNRRTSRIGCWRKLFSLLALSNFRPKSRYNIFGVYLRAVKSIVRLLGNRTNESEQNNNARFPQRHGTVHGFYFWPWTWALWLGLHFKRQCVDPIRTDVLSQSVSIIISPEWVHAHRMIAYIAVTEFSRTRNFCNKWVWQKGNMTAFLSHCPTSD
jgi:hypothetical protein